MDSGECYSYTREEGGYALATIDAVVVIVGVSGVGGCLDMLRLGWRRLYTKGGNGGENHREKNNDITTESHLGVFESKDDCIGIYVPNVIDSTIWCW